MPYAFNVFTGTFDYYQAGTYTPPTDSYLMLESGDHILLEDGSKLILE